VEKTLMKEFDFKSHSKQNEDIFELKDPNLKDFESMKQSKIKKNIKIKIKPSSKYQNLDRSTKLKTISGCCWQIQEIKGIKLI
jgi:hypothetical protein